MSKFVTEYFHDPTAAPMGARFGSTITVECESQQGQMRATKTERVRSA